MHILHKPLVTEKITKHNAKGVYGFIVDRQANKIAIKQAVEKSYGVQVEKVNTIHCSGKKKVRYTKLGVQKGQRTSYKKAIVTLKHGMIDFYANI